MVVAVGYARGKVGRFAEKLGYVCNDKFLDNGFVQGNLDIEKFKKKLQFEEETLKKRKIVVILPDYHIEESLQLISQVRIPIWVYPLHKREELNHFEKKDVWLGFPHKRHDKRNGVDLGRDYSLKWYLKNVSKKRWWMGLWDDTKLDYLKYFDGFDTTMFYFLCTKQGSTWTGWGRRKKAGIWKSGTEILKESFVNFRKYLLKKGIEIKDFQEGIL